MERNLVNPRGANRNVSDHRLYHDADGVPIGYPQRVEEWVASASVTEGQLVELVAATETAPETVKPSTTTANALLIIGVALNDASAGEIVRVCTRGVCHILVEDGVTPARGNGVKNGGTTAGRAGAETAYDANDVVGVTKGVYLAAKLTSYRGSDDYAVAYIAGA